MTRSLQVIDRRASKGKSSENRRKFLDRVRQSVREAMPSIVNQGKLKDIGLAGGSVTIRKQSIREPQFRFGKGGNSDLILPGNKDFVVGDQIEKPQGGQGGLGDASGDGAGQGQGEDPFIVQISREEFINFLFEDLELPDLARKELAEITETRWRTAGFSTTGAPSRLSVLRTMRMAHLRKIALRGAVLDEIESLERQEEESRAAQEEPDPLVQERLAALSNRKENLPFIDPIDLRYRSLVKEERPITSATMICIMDNSGSMDERKKTLSRKFFYLLYLFLSRKYERIDIRFIHHTESAREMSEEEFFSTRESGGTVVSSALDLLASWIPASLNPSRTNIYVCQCSDGDNSYGDNEKCMEFLRSLLPSMQYWAYIQIEQEGFWERMSAADDGSGLAHSLWAAYDTVSKTIPKLALRHVSSDSDIYPVFRALFERKSETKSA